MLLARQFVNNRHGYQRRIANANVDNAQGQGNDPGMAEPPRDVQSYDEEAEGEGNVEISDID